MSDFRNLCPGLETMYSKNSPEWRHEQDALRFRKIVEDTICRVCLTPSTEKAAERAYRSKMAVVPGTLINFIMQCQECGNLVEFEETK